MKEINVLRYGMTNTYLLGGKVLVDAGWTGSLPDFFKCAKQESVNIDTIDYLIITHFHPDHMGIAGDLAELGIRTVVFDVQKSFMHWADVLSEKRNRYFKPIKDDETVYVGISESREFLEKEGIAGEVIHTPGHSDDSISVILDSGAAIVGDMPPYPQIEAYGDPVIAGSWEKIIRCGSKRAYHAHWPEYDIKYGCLS